MDKIKIGIVGAAGYTAGELIRLLINHPHAELVFANSSSNAGEPVSSVHSGLIGDTDMRFTDQLPLDSIDLLFLCSAHGKSKEFWHEHQRPEHLHVIDLAQDYRDESEGYVYGLPELNREAIKHARSVANPGCFATAIQLALLPLSNAGILGGEANVTAVTGSTGAGVKPSATTHFSWRVGNMSVYKAFEHQHLAEIMRSLRKLQPCTDARVNFVPMRGDFARGIIAAVTLRCDRSEDAIKDIYGKYYLHASFTHIAPSAVDLKQVVNTNKCLIQIEKHGDMLLVVSVIDNLLKGASGQAVQNMNIMFGLDEQEGLRLKPSAF